MIKPILPAIDKRLIVLLSALSLGPLLFGCVAPWSRLILMIGIGLTFIAAHVGRPIRLTPRMLVGPGILIGLASVAVLQWVGALTPSNPAPLVPATVDADATLRIIVLLLAYSGLLISLPRILDTEEKRMQFCSGIAFLGAAIALIGLTQLAAGNTTIYGLTQVSPFRKPFGPYFNVNHAASLMSMAGLVAFGIWLGRARRLGPAASIGEKADLIGRRLVGLTPTFLCLIGVFATGSRGGAIAVLSGFTAVLLLWALKRLHGKTAVLFNTVAGGSVLVGIFWGLTHLSRLSQFSRAFDESSYFRISMYRSAWKMLGDRPLFGFGGGTFETAFPAYQEVSLVGHVEYLHSDWATLLVDFGLVGGLFGIGFIAFWLYLAWCNIRPLVQRKELGPTIGVIAACISFSIHSIFDFSLQVPGNAVILLSLVGWLVANAKRKARHV
jgi:O-antigen ligase